MYVKLPLAISQNKVEGRGHGGSNPCQGRNFCQDFGSTCTPYLVNSAMMNTLAIHCQWEDKTVIERTGQLP